MWRTELLDSFGNIEKLLLWSHRMCTSPLAFLLAIFCTLQGVETSQGLWRRILVPDVISGGAFWWRTSKESILIDTALVTSLNLKCLCIIFLATVAHHHRDVTAQVERHNGFDVTQRNLLRHEKSNQIIGQFDYIVKHFPSFKIDWTISAIACTVSIKYSYSVLHTVHAEIKSPCKFNSDESLIRRL